LWSAFAVAYNFLALKDGQIAVMGFDHAKEKPFLADTLLEALRVF